MLNPTPRVGPAAVADAARRSEFLRIANVCWLTLGGLALVTMPFYPGELVFFIILISVSSVSFVIVDALRRNGRTRLGGILFCGVVDATFYGLMILNYRIHGFEDLEASLTRVSALSFMGISIVFAGATIDRRAPPAFALLNTVLLFIAVIFVDRRMGPKVSIPIFWWLLAVAVWLYERHVGLELAGLEAAHETLERKVDERTEALLGALGRLDTAKRELESSNAELESFSYSVAHDLRGPLRRIVGFIQVLEEDYGGGLDEGARRVLTVIRGQSARMGQLIEDLLRLARVGRSPLVRASVDVTALARAMADDLTARDPGRRVTWSIAPDLRITADLGLTRVVLENLLGNAWKFTSTTPEPRIDVESRFRGSVREIVVRDNGVGFDPAYGDNLFQPFVRLHADSEFSGSGIGLATVARIVKRHGGTVRAVGELGKGATFAFTLEPEEG
jgi:signal transduction histidine kinase